MTKKSKLKLLLTFATVGAAASLVAVPALAISCTKKTQVEKIDIKKLPENLSKDFVGQAKFYIDELKNTVRPTLDKLTKKSDEEGKKDEQNLAKSYSKKLDGQIKDLEEQYNSVKDLKDPAPVDLDTYQQDEDKMAELKGKLRAQKATAEEKVEYQQLKLKFQSPKGEKLTQYQAISKKAEADRTEEEKALFTEVDNWIKVRTPYARLESQMSVSKDASKLYTLAVNTSNDILNDLNTGNSDGSIQTVTDRKVWIREINATNTTDGFDGDGSSSYGSELAQASYVQTGIKIMRIQPLNEAKTSSTFDKETHSELTKITTPSFYKYRLEGADAVIITTLDGKNHVFTNDNVESIDDQLAHSDSNKIADGEYKRIYQHAYSKDAKSVNSQEFNDAIQNFKSIQFTIRDAAWVNSKGDDSGYRTVATDYYYSWMRTALHDQQLRLASGATKESEKAMNAIMKAGSSRFTRQDQYPNEYIYALYNINSDNFYDESKFITKVTADDAAVKDRDAVTFTVIDDSKPAAGLDFLENLTGGSDFFAAPSQYIDAVNKSHDYKLKSFSDESTDKVLEILKSEEFRKSDVAKFGEYWYAENDENTLFAGPYYGTGFKDLFDTYKKNPLYWDQEWVKNPNTIEMIQNKYQAQPVDPSVFEQRQWNGYKQGTVSRVAYSSLTQSDKTLVNDAANEDNKYGLHTGQSLVTKTLMARMYLQSVPASFEIAQVNPSTDPAKYYTFNDAYAMLMWGGNLRTIADGKLSSFETYAVGTGLRFRTLIASAINWNKYMDDYSTQIQKPYLARIAPDATIGGKNHDTSSLKTPRDAYEDLNSLFGLDSNLNKVDFGGSIGNEISPKENQKAFSQVSTETDQYKSAGYEVAKKQMKALLDEFAKAHPDLLSQDNSKKVKYSLFFPYVNATQSYKVSADKVIELIQSLDPRLEVEVIYPSTAPEFYRAIYGSGTSFAGWGYDLNSIGSGFDGFSWQAQVIPTLYKIGTTPEWQDKLNSSFPELVKAAKELKSWTDSQIAAGKLVFHPASGEGEDAVPETTPDSLEHWTLSAQFNASGEFDYFSTKQGGTSTGEYSGQFWTHYTSITSNEDLIKLGKELSNFISPAELDTTQGISKNGFVPYLLQNGYVSTIQEDGIERYADFKIKTNK